MDLRQLRSFAAVAEEGSITRAAERLHLTQPALSRQIRDLEQGLGVKLFERVGRGIRLSMPGRALLDESRHILVRAEELERHAAVLATGEEGLLRIGATPQMIEGILWDALARFRPEHPGVDVRLVESGGRDAMDRLDRGEVDVAISAAAAHAAFSFRPLGELPVVAAVPPDHPLAKTRGLQVRDVAEHRILILSEGFQSRDMFLSACRLARATPRIHFQGGSPQTLLALVEAGHGIAVLPGTVRVGARNVAMARLFLDDRPLDFQLSAVLDPRRTPMPCIDDLVAELRAVVRSSG